MDERVLELVEAALLEQAEAEARKVGAKARIQPSDYDGCCVECGDSIGDARFKFGAVTCIDCQEHLERSARLRR